MFVDVPTSGDMVRIMSATALHRSSDGVSSFGGCLPAAFSSS
jgi:hypothetical protein